MDYDSWKLETPEDEALRKMGRVTCEDCDRARATNCCTTEYGPREYFLCERCAEKRDCADCGAFGTELVEDLTGHGVDQWLCVKCMEARIDAEEERDCDPS
jgi:hypothetical protein